MAIQPTIIDISNNPELVRLTEEITATNIPGELKRNNKIVAIILPASQAKKRKTTIKDALALAGAWADLPAEHMEEELDRIRHTSKPTPPFALDV